MKYTTIFEKIICIFEIISDSWLYIVFLGLITLFLILLGLKKISKKSCFILSFTSCLGTFGYTLYRYFEPISKMMNNLIDHLFMDIYFPSTYTYLFILVVIDIVTIGSLLNPKKEKIYKTIHSVCFITTNFILTIILEMISKNEIDIFSKTSLYSNTNFIILLEFSMNIFILWVVALFAIYIINNITERVMITKENKVLEKVNMEKLEINLSNDNLETEYLDKTPKEVIPTITNINNIEIDTTQKHFIPSFNQENDKMLENNDKYFITPNNNITIQNVTTPQEKQMKSFDNSHLNNSLEQEWNSEFITESPFDLSSFIPRKSEIKPIQNLNINPNKNTNEIFEKILKNELPIIQQETTLEKEKLSNLEDEKDTYTLNDYRIFNKMLKDIREHNQSNSVRIDKDLEYRLITKYSTETYNMFKKMLKIYSN